MAECTSIIHNNKGHENYEHSLERRSLSSASIPLLFDLRLKNGVNTYELCIPKFHYSHNSIFVARIVKSIKMGHNASDS